MVTLKVEIIFQDAVYLLPHIARSARPSHLQLDATRKQDFLMRKSNFPKSNTANKKAERESYALRDLRSKVSHLGEKARSKKFKGRINSHHYFSLGAASAIISSE
jgi:hypothetical protein